MPARTWYAAERAADAGGVSWADFFVDLARLEHGIQQVFDGPGVEDQPLLAREQLQAIGQAIARLAAVTTDVDKLAEQVQQSFELWGAEGFFCRLGL